MHGWWTQVFIHFTDIGPDGGCTAIVPGSHKLLSLPNELLPGLFDGSNADSHHLDNMPNAHKFAVPAGTACIFGM